MTRSRRALVVLGVLAAVFLPAVPASAHPLGNFTVNRYDGLLIGPGSVLVDHVLDLAEIPTVQVRSSVDADGDKRLSAPELQGWADGRCAQERSGLELAVGGTSVSLTVTRASARTLPGQAGLETLRLECELRAPVDFAAKSTAVTFSADFPEQVGWREITVRGNRTTLSPEGAASLRSASVSRRLSTYPEDLLSSPLNERSVAFTVAPGGGRALPESSSEGVLDRPTDRLGAAFTDLVGGRDLGAGAAILAVGLALLIGALHAVAPGHGKTIMAFYLVGRGESRTRAARAAVTVGATVTLTHTAGVLVLGLIVAGTASATPAAAYPWLAAASGLVIAIVGLGLLREAWRRSRTGETGHGHSHTHGHDHPHPHAHPHPRSHSHSHGPAHSHGPGNDHAAHSHDDDHGTDHGNEHGHQHDDEHSHEHDDEHDHESEKKLTVPALASAGTAATLPAVTPTGSGTRQQVSMPVEASSHPHNVVGSAPPAPDDGVIPGRRGRAGLIAVGVAGGLVPSPSALVVLLGAAAVGRAWFGVVLVVAFGIGMAATLSATGLLLVVAQDRLNRMGRPRWFPALRWFGYLPLLSACAVCVLGIVLMTRGLMAVS